MTWIVQIDEDAAKDIRKLPDSIKARFARTVSLIEASGPSDLPPSYVKHMGDGLYELRLKDKSGIARVFYVTVKPKRMIVLSAFVKKTQKTPKREIEKALTRRKAKQ